jgi:hypothetical protein
VSWSGIHTHIAIFAPSSQGSRTQVGTCDNPVIERITEVWRLKHARSYQTGAQKELLMNKAMALDRVVVLKRCWSRRMSLKLQH